MGLNRKQIAMLAVLVLGGFTTILNQTLVTPALPTIMTEMEVDASTVQWLTTGFTLVNAVMIPITAYLTDRFSTRRLFAISMTIFAVGTAMVAASTNFAFLLTGRMIQAAGAGILMPMIGVVLMLTFPVERRGSAMGLFGLIMMLAPAIGPTLSGVIIDHTSWHYMFFGIAAISLVMVFVSVGVIEKQEKIVPKGLYLDKPSVVLSTFGFGGVLYGFSIIGSSGFSITAGAAVVLGGIVMALFFRRQLKLDVPMLEMRVLKVRKFTVSTIIGMVIQASLLANGVLMPMYVQSLMGYSATATGIVLLPGAILMGIMSPISGRMFDKRGARGMSIVGLALLTVGTVCMCMLNLDSPLWYLCVIITLRNFAMSLCNMPLSTWGMNALDNRYINHGNAVGNTFRQVAGSFGCAIVISVFSLVASNMSGSMGSLEASMMGIRAAYFVQLILVAIALILTIAMVKDKEEDAAAADPTNERKSMLETVMHRDVFAVPSTASVAEAIDFFREKGISAAPIVDSEGNVAGFVSDGDVIRALGSRNANVVDPLIVAMAPVSDEDAREFAESILKAPVMSIAVHKCITADVHSGMDAILHVLGENHLKKVPITENGKLVGIVSRSDITRAVLESFRIGM